MREVRYDLWKDFQAIDLMKKVLTTEEYVGFLKGNILKYKLRDKGQDFEDNIKVKAYQGFLDKMQGKQDNQEQPDNNYADISNLKYEQK
jgi:hypothetical protein